jgi:hypothetical protein
MERTNSAPLSLMLPRDQRDLNWNSVSTITAMALLAVHAARSAKQNVQQRAHKPQSATVSQIFSV